MTPPPGVVYWQTVPEKTKQYWLELVDPEGWWSAAVRFDGCIHFYRYMNNPKGDPQAKEDDIDYLHICDLDDLIVRLQAMRDIARSHFGKEWK